MAQSLGLPPQCVRKDGFVAAGCPLGDAEFVQAHATGVAEVTQARVDTLVGLPLPAQDKLLLLRKSLQCRVHHLARAAEQRHVQTAMRDVEDAVVGAVFTIIGRDPAGCPDAAEQMQLPLRLGGMGIHSLSAANGLPCAAAFLAQAALTHTAVAKGTPRFDPFTGPMRTTILSCAERVRNEASIAGWPEDLSALEEHVQGILPHAQRKVCQELAATRAAALRDRFQPDATPNCDQAAARSDQARLLSVADSTAGAWLDAMPTCGGLTLSDGDVVAGVRFRLGLSPIPLSARPVRCDCKTLLTAANPDHAMTCPRLAGARTMRHDVVQSTWCRIGFANAVPTSKEPMDHHLASEAVCPGTAGYEKRCDILFALTKDLVVGDVTVTHPGGARVVAGASKTAGYAAQHSAKMKRAKHPLSGAKFVALAMESYGRMCPEAEDFLRDQLVGADRADSSAALRNARMRLSVAVCRGNGIIFRRAAATLVRVSGRGCQDGAPAPFVDE